MTENNGVKLAIMASQRNVKIMAHEESAIWRWHGVMSKINEMKCVKTTWRQRSCEIANQ